MSIFATKVIVTAASVLSLFNTVAPTNIGGLTYYVRSGIVTEVNHVEDTVTFEDKAGNLWAFYGTEGWAEGRALIALMNRNGTATLMYDDTIVAVKGV